MASGYALDKDSADMGHFHHSTESATLEQTQLLLTTSAECEVFYRFLLLGSD